MSNEYPNCPGGVPSLHIEGRVATVTLRRPDVANRLESQDIETLLEHVETVNQSDALVLRVMSTGKYFCSGYNISEMKSGENSGFETLANAIEDCRPVTIAAIQGGAYGGATDLVLACDFRVGSRNANMFMPAARLGLHFYQRGMERYLTRLGLDMAKRLFLTAEKIDAGQMLACGFLTHLIRHEDLEDEVQRLTNCVASMAPMAILGMKRHLNQLARNVADAEQIREDAMRSRCSADLLEGRLAWKEKRQPKFQGR